MIDQSRLLFIHGLMGSSQGYKATLLRQAFPDMLIPDFPGEFDQRMVKLSQVIGTTTGWTLIGSSLGGLMATEYAIHQSRQVEKLVLFAPALPWLPNGHRHSVEIPTIIFHGRQDEVVPLQSTQEIARQIFENLSFNIVDDDHGMGKTVENLDWLALLARSES
ncbi:MAG: YqiA/YcfP family alpha/beta fold hydrolase [Chloroflexota bacterium]|nr:YqiA/YcfP family alpha/beta fold hydrolase [Chloroflexota bacterium]